MFVESCNEPIVNDGLPYVLIMMCWACRSMRACPLYCVVVLYDVVG